jgi:hypothetical protein
MCVWRWCKRKDAAWLSFSIKSEGVDLGWSYCLECSEVVVKELDTRNLFKDKRDDLPLVEMKYAG